MKSIFKIDLLAPPEDVDNFRYRCPMSFHNYCDKLAFVTSNVLTISSRIDRLYIATFRKRLSGYPTSIKTGWFSGELSHTLGPWCGPLKFEGYMSGI